VEDIFHFKMCFPDTLEISAGAFHIVIGTWLPRMVHPSFFSKIKYENCSWKKGLWVVTGNLVGTGRNQEQQQTLPDANYQNKAHMKHSQAWAPILVKLVASGFTSNFI
jgi:hypothetical protein